MGLWTLTNYWAACRMSLKVMKMRFSVGIPSLQRTARKVTIEAVLPNRSSPLTALSLEAAKNAKEVIADDFHAFARVCIQRYRM